jgi:GT2 family glycosyltransferase
VRRDDPSLSIALASYNRRERLRKTLLALAEQRLPAQQFEVNLVLDGSTDGSAEMCRGIDLPFKLTVHQQENRGLAASRNQGARMAAHNLVLFLDDDIELSAGGLLAHAKAHGASRDAHMALGYYPPALEAKSLWAIVVRNWWEDHFRRKADSPRAWHFTDVVDGNSSIPKDLFFRLGGFDERFRGGRRQDYEFGIRLLRAGVHIGYYRRALGHHFFDARVETAFRNSRDEGRYDALTAQIHPSVATQLPLVRVAALLRRPRFARAAFHRTVGHVPSEVVLPLLRSLETSNARGKWMALMNRTLLRSYALGAIEFWGGLEAALEHLRPLLAQTRPALRVPIDGSTFPLGPTVEATDVEISLYGRSVGAVRAIPPGAQWDWDDFLDRAADELTESLKLEALASALSGDPS